jgi:hypothetical protein
MKKWIGVSVIAALTFTALKFLEPAVAWASCSLKTWSGGNVVLPTDLNSNFACLNTNLKGSGNTLITSSDFATGALTRTNWAPISTAPAGIWASTATCSAVGTCNSVVTSSLMTVSLFDAGTYSVVVSPSRADNSYVASVTSNDGLTLCKAVSYATGGFNVVCNNTSATPTNASFTILLWDDE